MGLAPEKQKLSTAGVSVNEVSVTVHTSGYPHQREGGHDHGVGECGGEPGVLRPPRDQYQAVAGGGGEHVHEPGQAGIHHDERADGVTVVGSFNDHDGAPRLPKLLLPVLWMAGEFDET